MSGNTLNLSGAIQKIRSISYALNNLEVKGRENLDILLGSIQTLDKTAAELQRGLEAFEEPEIKIEAVPDNEPEKV